MLTYTFITFARNAYHSFTENSLVYGNVRQACLFGVSRWSAGFSDYPEASLPL